ncbi:MAG: protein-methionine-sulfoxide reductase heme-binding subunit MsrQ [Pseudorhodobacter sp.]
MLSGWINGWTRRIRPGWIYVGGVLPVFWLIWQLNTGALGVDPVKRIEHSLGLWGLQWIIAGLCVTPLRRWGGVNLIRFRRAIGLVAFGYVFLHLLVWITLDLQFRWAEIGTDILKRPYITMGMAGFLLMVPLALTSNNGAVRRMGAAAWQRLHRLTYLAALAGAIHYLWLVKAWPPEPILYLGAVILLLLVRFTWRRRKQRIASVPAN